MCTRFIYECKYSLNLYTYMEKRPMVENQNKLQQKIYHRKKVGFIVANSSAFCGLTK